MTVLWKYSLFGKKGNQDPVFLDRSTRLKRLTDRSMLEVQNYDLFEIFMDSSEHILRGYVQPNGHIDWVKEY